MCSVEHPSEVINSTNLLNHLHTFIQYVHCTLYIFRTTFTQGHKPSERVSFDLPSTSRLPSSTLPYQVFITIIIIINYEKMMTESMRTLAWWQNLWDHQHDDKIPGKKRTIGLSQSRPHRNSQVSWTLRKCMQRLSNHGIPVRWQDLFAISALLRWLINRGFSVWGQNLD